MKEEDIGLNILIRTANRPNYFRNCIKSVEKFAPYATLHISVDDSTSIRYVKELAGMFNPRIYEINRNAVIKLCSKIKITRKEFIYNHYFNIMKPFLNGWCLTLDDDDELIMTPSFADCPDNIYLYKQLVKGRVFPSEENFGRLPVLGDIGGNCIIFHSSKMVDWKPQRGGDYDFILEMFNNNNPVWIDEILVKIQTGGNFGRRNDLER